VRLRNPAYPQLSNLLGELSTHHPTIALIAARNETRISARDTPLLRGTDPVNRINPFARRPAALLATSLAAVLLAACSRGGVGAGATATPSTAGTSSVQLKVAQSNLGMILTDASGRTLYAFMKDTGDKSACTDAKCVATWPALTVPSGQQASAGDGATAEWIHSITRDDGSTQVSYGGHPLYYFSGDKAAGDTNGEGLLGQWFAVSGDGQPVQASAPASASPSASASASESASGGYGY
jgi:predicted lipoprotein with Yx(FWY)xxD motif